MKHCVECWFNQQLVSEAMYLYEGSSLCRVHLEGKRSRVLSEPKVKFVEDPKPRKKVKR